MFSPTRTSKPLWPVLVLLVSLALMAAACGDDDDTGSADTSEQSDDNGDDATTDDDPADSGDETDPGDEAALETVSDEVVMACGDQDRDRLRDMSGDGIRDRIRDRDPLFSAVDELTVTDRVISIDGDAATVTVTLDVTIGGETTEVERVWSYENVDGIWVLSDVPDCLFS